MGYLLYNVLNMKKNVLNEVSNIKKLMGIVSETMDISDIETQSALDGVMKELNVPVDVVTELQSCGVPQEVSKYENSLLKLSVPELKTAYKEVVGKIKDGGLKEQAETAIIIGGMTISLPMVMLGLLALGILTG